MRRSPLLDRAGAVPNAVGDPDELVPAHYGDPLREQRLLESAAAVTVLARDVVAVTGADRLSWLTTLSSQVLTDLTPGDGGVETLVLDAKGRIVHALALIEQRQLSGLVIYSDSQIALTWVRKKRCKTLLERTPKSEPLFDLIQRAERWLQTHTYTTPVYKWDTVSWGEIPADYGRK